MLPLFVSVSLSSTTFSSTKYNVKDGMFELCKNKNKTFIAFLCFVHIGSSIDVLYANRVEISWDSNRQFIFYMDLYMNRHAIYEATEMKGWLSGFDFPDHLKLPRIFFLTPGKYFNNSLHSPSSFPQSTSGCQTTDGQGGHNQIVWWRASTWKCGVETDIEI